jgi:hypothetical protein
MIGAVLYLTGCSIRNRWLRAARRLRQPRYLLALALGLAYLWFALFSQRQRATFGMAAVTDGFATVVALLLVALAVKWWVLGTDHLALAFSPAEIQFLFPAPVTRRGLIHYKLLRIQTALLINTLLWTVLLRRGAGQGGPVLRALALWTLFSTLYLHRLGASLTRLALEQHGWSGVRRRVLTLSALGAVTTALLVGFWQHWPSIESAWREDLGELLFSLRGTIETPPISWALWPFLALVRPITARSPWEWAHAIVPAVGLMLAHYAWVVRSDTAFEEAALAASRARLRLLARMRARSGAAPVPSAGSLRTVLPLAPAGWPASAIVWKNLTGELRGASTWKIVIATLGLVVVVALSTAGSGGAIAMLIAMLALAWVAMLVLIGPQWVRNDLRRDLAKADILRGYPLSGTALVSAEVFSSTILLSAIEMVLLLVAYLALLSSEPTYLDLASRTGILAALALILPAVNLIALGIQNAGALLYPSWVRLDTRPGGIEALGQNLLTMIASVLLLTLALAGPLLLGGSVVYFLEARLAGWVWPASVGLFVGGVLLEGWLLLDWLGTVFEKFDPSREGVGG